MGNLIGGKDDKMSYKFKITRGNAILNFSEEYCQSRCELIESESFARVLKGYVHDIKRKKTTAYEYLSVRSIRSTLYCGVASGLRANNAWLYIFM